MPTIKAGKDAYMTVNLFKITGSVASEIALNINAAELESAVIGTNWKDYMQGQVDATIDASGTWDAGTAATALDGILYGMVNAGGTKMFEFVPGGSVANETKYGGNCLCNKYAISAPVGGVVGFSASFRNSGSITRSVVA